MLGHDDSFGEWCNGSTTASGAVCLGSNPSSPVHLPHLISSFQKYQSFGVYVFCRFFYNLHFVMSEISLHDGVLG